LSYQVLIERRALKELSKLPPTIIGRINAAMDGLRSQPRPHNAKKLAGSRDQWRVRVGDYRVLYEINDRIREVHVFAVGHRREIYR
jgi:mRNA interferase RelE/StbE